MGNSVGAVVVVVVVVVVEIFLLPENSEEMLFSDGGGGKVCGMFDQLHLLPTQKHQLGFDFISAEGWILLP